MPKSRSKRSTYIPPKPPNPKPSPRWVPWVGLSGIAVGLLAVILVYALGPAVLPNWMIFVGLGVAGLGLVVLSRWR